MNAAAALPRIAILMTCHNRRETTLRCLRSLSAQRLFQESDLYLVDDGSSDGTGEAVRQIMPQANIIKGDGSLFWNGGMRRAWDAAVSSVVDYDFYLWLNDDVELGPGTLDALIADAGQTAKRGEAVVVAAASCDPDDPSQITYGAHRRTVPRRPFRLTLVAPTGQPEPVDTISGNIVLVSAAVEQAIGNLSPSIKHIYGDLDYAIRARLAGIPVVLASRIGGICKANSLAGTSSDKSLSKWARLRLRWHESRAIHARDWRCFVAMHNSSRLERAKHRIGPYLRILLTRGNDPL